MTTPNTTPSDLDREALIKYMVYRFLGWKLPDNFNPDAGISFKAEYNENSPWPMKHKPMGTNLFDAVQTEAMVRYLLDGADLPRASGVPEAELRESFNAGVAWQKEMEAPPVAAPSGEAELKVGKSLIRKAELLPPFDLSRILALREAERFMAYFAGETDGTFAGPGTPKNCLAQIRQALAGLPASPIASEPKGAGSGEGQNIAEQAAQFLWSLLDDIDTVGDHVKADNAAYRELVERIQRRRFEVGDTDGYTVTFKRKAEIRTAPSGTKP